MTDTSKVQGTPALIQKLKRVGAKAAGIVDDAQLAKLLEKRVRARFMAGVAPDGSKWPELDPDTVSAKRRKGYAKPKAPLQATGNLLGALHIIQGGNFGLLAGNTGLGFRIGVDSPVEAFYGRIHNYGYDVQPQRQFIGLSTLDVASIGGALRRRLKSIAKA